MWKCSLQLMKCTSMLKPHFSIYTSKINSPRKNEAISILIWPSLQTQPPQKTISLALSENFIPVNYHQIMISKLYIFYQRFWTLHSFFLVCLVLYGNFTTYGFLLLIHLLSKFLRSVHKGYNFLLLKLSHFFFSFNIL